MPRKPASTKSAPRTSTGSKPKPVAQATKPTAAATKPRPAAKPAAPAAASKTLIAPAPSAEQISKRAYEIWLRKGRPLGQDTQNWLEAEAELKVKR